MASISELYDRYGIPDALRTHMLRVAAIGCLIADEWTGPHLRVDEMRRVLLLHDMGNVVKIASEDPEAESRRAAFIAKYGSDDHDASRAIGREVGLSDSDLELMEAKVFVRNDETLKSSDYTRKIAAYSDQRVSPEGVEDLMARLREAETRYRDKPGASMNNPRTPLLVKCAARIEEQIKQYLRISPGDITNASIAPYVHQLAMTKIP